MKSGSRIFNMDVDANDSKTCYESFKVSCIKQIGDTEKFNCFLKELNDICCNNSFLNRISLASRSLGYTIPKNIRIMYLNDKTTLCLIQHY